MIPGILLILPFTIYLLTLCPTVYLGDSGELTAAAYSLGVPHATGYPLYVLIGKVFCLIPLGSVAFRANLMSAAFGIGAVWMVYSLIVRMSLSRVGGLVGGLVLAFASVVWMQAICAEVYTPHVFFVALMARLLWWWDEKREFSGLLAFVFVVGLSFGNHLQTVILAPGVLWIVLSGERRRFFKVKRFLMVSVCFAIPLLIYLYLPIRTWAGAAIHWGDPDSVDRFMTHVMATAHRAAYVFNLTPWDYVERAKEAIWLLVSQFGVILIFAIWGWLNLGSKRWQVFFATLVACDFFYTIFMNTVSLEITPFNLPSSVAVAILAGFGIGRVLEKIKRYEGIGVGTRRLVEGASGVVPIIPLLLNFSLCDQSRNYTAYEQTVNIYRTMDKGNVLFVNGDNYVFPAAYGRIVERMGEHLVIYDRLSLIFKMPDILFHSGPRPSSWEQGRNQAEKKIIEEKKCEGVYYAIFGPGSVDLPEGCSLVPCGTLYRPMRERAHFDPMAGNIWRYYSTESFNDNFQRDYMNRQMAAYFEFFRGMAFILSGESSLGLKRMKIASEVGYDDELLYSDMGVFLTDQGFFVEARGALEKALIYHEDLSAVYNNWGYYYQKMRDHEGAVASFKKAVELRPDRFGYYNNLGFAYFEMGDKRASKSAFEKSLGLQSNQPRIKQFIKENLESATTRPGASDS
jgi:tetratricopeptide (TPR) repeat protein